MQEEQRDQRHGHGSAICRGGGRGGAPPALVHLAHTPTPPNPPLASLWPQEGAQPRGPAPTEAAPAAHDISPSAQAGTQASAGALPSRATRTPAADAGVWAPGRAWLWRTHMGHHAHTWAPPGPGRAAGAPGMTTEKLLPTAARGHTKAPMRNPTPQDQKPGPRPRGLPEHSSSASPANCFPSALGIGRGWGQGWQVVPGAMGSTDGRGRALVLGGHRSCRVTQGFCPSCSQGPLWTASGTFRACHHPGSQSCTCQRFSAGRLAGPPTWLPEAASRDRDRCLPSLATCPRAVPCPRPPALRRPCPKARPTCGQHLPGLGRGPFLPLPFFFFKENMGFLP